MNIYSIGKVKSPIIFWIVSQGPLRFNQFKISNFGDYIISMPYVSHAELGIVRVAMLITSSGMGKEHIKNT